MNTIILYSCLLSVISLTGMKAFPLAENEPTADNNDKVELPIDYRQVVYAPQQQQQQQGQAIVVQPSSTIIGNVGPVQPPVQIPFQCTFLAPSSGLVGQLVFLLLGQSGNNLLASLLGCQPGGGLVGNLSGSPMGCSTNGLSSCPGGITGAPGGGVAGGGGGLISGGGGSAVCSGGGASILGGGGGGGGGLLSVLGLGGLGR